VYLIKNNNWAPPQHRSRQANELALALAEVAAAGVNLRVEFPLVAGIVADL